MNKALVALVALLSLVVASPVLAATFSAGQSYTLDKQTTVSDDLYAAASSPIVSGTILGDAMLAGGSVTFDGSTKNNLMAAGGTITILGKVGSSVRAMGGTITLSGPVGADVVAAGGTISVIDTATIGRDAALAGGNVQLGGTIGRNATVRGGTVVINGIVNGNVDVQASQKFTLGEHALIKGTLTYSSPAEVVETPGASVVGAVTYTQTKNTAKDYTPAGAFAAFSGLLFILKFLAIATAVIVATTLFRRATSSVVLATIESFWKDLCIGFVALIIIPIACIVLLITIFGAVFGFLGMLAYATLVVAAKVASPIVAGAFLSKWYKKEATVDWKWSLLGLIVLDLIGLVPIVGWVVGAVLFLTAFGTLASLAYYKIADAR